MDRSQLLSISFVLAVMFASAGQAFSQAQAGQNRIAQQVIINGQRVNAVYVSAPGGGMQSFTCSNPQPYTTPDGGSQGWTCYEQATGTWLLNAVPPAGSAVSQGPSPAQTQPQQPAVIYQQPPTVVYQAPPALVYAAPVYPVVVASPYAPSVILEAAAINATGRIISAAVLGSHFYYPGYFPQRAFYSFPGRRRW
jgi:hypothetical protein